MLRGHIDITSSDWLIYTISCFITVIVIPVITMAHKNLEHIYTKHTNICNHIIINIPNDTNEGCDIDGYN